MRGTRPTCDDPFMEREQAIGEFSGDAGERPDSACRDLDEPATRSSYGRLVASRLASLRFESESDTPQPEPRSIEERVRGWVPATPRREFPE
jgi:hypothetical protein